MGQRINCCKDCVPPKRHIGCWGECPEYKKERLLLDEKKEAERDMQYKNAYFAEDVKKHREKMIKRRKGLHFK